MRLEISSKSIAFAVGYSLCIRQVSVEHCRLCCDVPARISPSWNIHVVAVRGPMSAFVIVFLTGNMHEFMKDACDEEFLVRRIRLIYQVVRMCCRGIILAGFSYPAQGRIRSHIHHRE